MTQLPKLKLHGITILRIFITSFILGFVAEAHAGLHGLTAHSRSNCVNNESWHGQCECSAHNFFGALA
jgi:hypothetical protein